MLASKPDYSIQVIDNLPAKSTGAVLSFIAAIEGPTTGKGRIKTRRWRRLIESSYVVTGPPSITTSARGQPNALVRSAREH